MRALPQLWAPLDAGSKPPAPVDAGQPATDPPDAGDMPSVSPIFDDVTRAVGVVATHGKLEPYVMTGQAFGDVDGDGYLDLYVTSMAGPNRLYIGGRNGTFSPSSVTAQVELRSAISGGALFADFDNDGDQDLYVLNWGPNALFRNDGDSFTDVARVAGVDDPRMGTGAAFADYDNDGDLDLYVVNWRCDDCVTPDGPEGSADRLYENRGDGTFGDVTQLLGRNDTEGAGYAAVWFDFDDDGDSDLYLVNDKGSPGPRQAGFLMNRNLLWRNDGAGCGGWCFSEIGERVGADARVDGMGVAIGDYDQDGDLDIAFSDDGPVQLLENRAGQFVDVAPNAGLTYSSVGWGTLMIDVDNDSYLDLYVAFGNSGLTMFGGDDDRLFRNLGNGTFDDITEAHGMLHNGPTMGAAAADFDRDGFIDVVTGDYDVGYHVYRNTGVLGQNHNWIRVRTVGGGPVNRDGVGAKVRVRTHDGRVLYQQVHCGASLGAGNDLALHFGLGRTTVQSIDVTWPDGHATQVADPAVNREWVVTRCPPETTDC